MPELDGKVAVVTGATSGIGRGIVERLAVSGAAVVVHGLNLTEAEAVAAELRHRGHRAIAAAADLHDATACRRVITAGVEAFGGVDVLVNNAASTARAYLETASVEEWDAIMAVNLRAPFLLIQEAVRSMKTRGGGSIVNIGSVNAYIGEPKLGPYAVSKGGLMTLTRNAASALGKYRIRVNQLNVGWTLTEGEDRVKRAEGKGDEWVAEAAATRPFGRLLHPSDVAAAVEYFASDRGAFVSGAVLDVEQFPVGAPPNW
jgi:NAD(P)-dependent dehydrogenase (short-subunit alcohol dehydrogenase family)